MPALVGVLLSYASLMAGGPVAGGDAGAAICAVGDACQLPALAAQVNPDATTYANPVEVDCRAIGGGAAGFVRDDLQLLSGACAAPAWDFRYRVSRFPDSERSSGGFAPERTRRALRAGETCTGLPPDRGSLVSASAPPLAIYAYTLMPLTPLAAARVVADGDRRAPHRIVEPPDRPPRA